MPFGLAPRDYQVEAAEAAIQGNVIVNLPTGTGKTLIAAMVIEALASRGSGPALLVVPTQALMDQHKKYFNKIRLRVYVNTAAAALQALEDGVLPAPHLVVFDEVHHCVKEHPYVGICKFMAAQDKTPEYRLLGLTASFIHGSFTKLSEKRAQLETVLQAQTFVPPSFTQDPEKLPQYYKVDFDSPRDLPSEREVFELTTNTLAPFMFLAPPNLRYAITEETHKNAYSVYCTLGSEGWLLYLRHGLIPIVQSKLRQKAEYVASKAEICPPSQDEMLVAISELDKMQEQLQVLPGQGTISPKVRALVELVQATPGPGLVFVERKALCVPLKHILDYSGVMSLAVMGVQAMSEAHRVAALEKFANCAVDVLVTTPSLEEGIDVRVCRFVVRFDYFSTVRSHIQGSGRVRTTDAKIYYFEQDPEKEIKKADLVVRTAKGEATELEIEQQIAETTIEGVETIEELGPHTWGNESTAWDVITNRSYRGMSCNTCGCRCKIVSKKFGLGKKKSKRTYVVLSGSTECK